MSDFKDRYGLGFLIKGKDSTPEHSDKIAMPHGMQDALIVYGRLILESLKQKPNNSLPIFEIARDLNMQIETLLQLVKYLITKGYLFTVQEDPIGNDVVGLTDAGKKLLT